MIIQSSRSIAAVLMAAYWLLLSAAAITTWALISGWWSQGSIVCLIFAVLLIPIWSIPLLIAPLVAVISVGYLLHRWLDDEPDLFLELSMEKVLHLIKSALYFAATGLLWIGIIAAWIFLIGTPESWWLKILGGLAALCCTPVLIRAASGCMTQSELEQAVADVIQQARVQLLRGDRSGLPPRAKSSRRESRKRRGKKNRDRKSPSS